MIAPTFRITEIEPGIYLAMFDHRRDVTQSMMRLQEYYEGVSDNIRGKYFSLEDFLHHFTTEDGIFEYTSTWSGFNVPGHIVEEWYTLFYKTDGLTKKEQLLFDNINTIKKSSDKWYLIATSSADKNNRVVEHEVAHGRYYLHDSYKLACDNIISNLDTELYEHFKHVLMNMGYNEYVINDEIQAYFSTSKISELKEWFGTYIDWKSITKKFRKIYKKGVIYE